MKIKVLYFAQLREKFGLSEEEIQLPESVRNANELIVLLSTRGGAWSETFESSQAFRIAMNQEMIALDTPLVDGAELAIFRPVTGG
jgi:molybdopterin converting factor subunit 1